LQRGRSGVLESAAVEFVAKKDVRAGLSETSRSATKAHMGWLSTDRKIVEYAQEIWNAPFRPIV
jgi:glucan phosphorylase